jgi:hypothetical protein
MDIEKKKITAAIAAVAAYLQEEAAAAAQAAMASETPVAAFREPEGYVRPWAASGRQTMMQVRNLMQMRTFVR